MLLILSESLMEHGIAQIELIDNKVSYKFGIRQLL